MSRRRAFATLDRLEITLPTTFRGSGLPRRAARRMVTRARDALLTAALVATLQEASRAGAAGRTTAARDRLDDAESLRALFSRAGLRALRELDR